MSTPAPNLTRTCTGPAPAGHLAQMYRYRYIYGTGFWFKVQAPLDTSGTAD